MSRTVKLGSFLCMFLLAAALGGGCSLDPHARKQKFLEQGNRYFEQGKYPEALLLYGRALQIDPRFSEAHYKMAQCHLNQRSWPAAFQELQQTIDLQPENWPAQLDLGQLLFAAGKAQEAKDRALLILRSNPQHADAQMLLANSDAVLGDLKAAIVEANKATEIAPGRAAVFLTLASIQMRAGALADAEANLKRAKSVDPASTVPVMMLGAFYQQQSRWEEAEREFAAAQSLAPKEAAPRAALVVLYTSQRKDALAEKILIEAKQQLNDPAGYRMLGDYYLSRGENAKALTEFADLLAEHPNDFEVRKTYIQLLILNHRIEEATQLNEEILKKYPRDSEALLFTGQIELQQKKLDQAVQTFQLALKNAPENAMGHYQLGLAFQEKGNSNQAESAWHEAVRLRPNFSEAWQALGASATRRGDWKALERIGDQLKRIAPRFADGYLLHATARVNQGDASGAETDLNELLRIAPEKAIGYAKLGQLRFSQKRRNEAEAFFREALSADPNSVDALQGLVALDLQRNKPEDALRLIQAQLQLRPAEPALYVLRGEALFHNKQLDEAEKALAHAVEIDKQNVNAFALLAQVEMAEGSTDHAISNYKRAIEVAPNSVQLYIALGGIYESQGNWQAAQPVYQKVLAIEPDNPIAANNLAYILLEHGGSVNVALTLAQTARRGLPNLANSADTLAWAYFHNGAFSVAAPLLEDAVKKAPDNSGYHYHLGLTYQNLNDSVRARTELEKAISLDPKSPIAEEARRALSRMPGAPRV
jgi:tetratricopeptide (TPR) repeat protein